MGEDVEVLKVVKQDKKFTIELEEGGGAGLGTILSSRDKKHFPYLTSLEHNSR